MLKRAATQNLEEIPDVHRSEDVAQVRRIEGKAHKPDIQVVVSSESKGVESSASPKITPLLSQGKSFKSFSVSPFSAGAGMFGPSTLGNFSTASGSTPTSGSLLFPFSKNGAKTAPAGEGDKDSFELMSSAAKFEGGSFKFDESDYKPVAPASSPFPTFASSQSYQSFKNFTEPPSKAESIYKLFDELDPATQRMVIENLTNRKKSEESEATIPKFETTTSSDSGEPVDITTGEEEDLKIFSVQAKLFELENVDSAPQYKERGVGILKLNSFKDQPNNARLVMRVAMSNRLILNTRIISQMTIEKPADKNIRFVSYQPDGKPQVFLIRFGKKDDCDELYHLLLQYKKTSTDIKESSAQTSSEYSRNPSQGEAKDEHAKETHESNKEATEATSEASGHSEEPEEGEGGSEAGTNDSGSSEEAAQEEIDVAEEEAPPAEEEAPPAEEEEVDVDI